MQKAGSKELFHTILRWNQIHHATIKVDVCLVFCLVTCDIVYEANIILQILGGIGYVISIAYVFAMKYCLRKESTKLMTLFLSLRLLFIPLSLYRVITLCSSNLEFFDEDNGDLIIISIFTFMALIYVLTVCISVKCILYFGKGFRDMVDNQSTLELVNDNEILNTDPEI